MTENDLNKRERAERGLDDLRATLEEIVDDGSQSHPGIDGVRDAATGLDGLDVAEEALRKWRERNVGESNKPVTRDELERRARNLAGECEDLEVALDVDNEYDAADHVSVARDVLQHVVADGHVDWKRSVARVEAAATALERGCDEIEEHEEGRETIESLLSDLCELIDDLEERPYDCGSAPPRDVN